MRAGLSSLKIKNEKNVIGKTPFLVRIFRVYSRVHVYYFSQIDDILGIEQSVHVYYLFFCGEI